MHPLHNRDNNGPRHRQRRLQRIKLPTILLKHNQTRRKHLSLRYISAKQRSHTLESHLCPTARPLLRPHRNKPKHQPRHQQIHRPRSSHPLCTLQDRLPHPATLPHKTRRVVSLPRRKRHARPPQMAMADLGNRRSNGY